MLGIYSVAFMLSDATARLVSTVGQRALFPAFGSVIRSDPGRLGPAYDRVRSWLDLMALPFIGVLIGAGPLLVGALFDRRYAAAGPMLQILSIRVAVGCTMVPGFAALLALGRPRYGALASMAKAAWLFAAIPAGWSAAGFTGAVWAVGLSDLIAIPVAWAGLHRAGLARPWLEARAIALVVAGCAAGLAAQRLISG